MQNTSEKLLCSCGCAYGIVEKIKTSDGGCILIFRKRQNRMMHYIEIPLPKGISFDTVDISPVNYSSK